MSGSVLIAAGGTGGHISPGVALAEVLAEKISSFGFDAVYLHSLIRNKDNPDLLNPPCEVLWHNVPQLGGIKTLIYPLLFLFPFMKTILLFHRLKVRAVIGMGGYSSLPSILYAILFRKQLYLCEQNCVPGKITRIFSRFSKKIAFSFPLSEGYAIKGKTIGNPIRKRVIPEHLNIRQNENLHEGKKNTVNVLVLGGSQGARQLNQMILKTMENSEIASKYKFRLLTGTSLYEETKSKSSGNAEIISYANDMKPNYEWANIVVARSGAGVLAECLVFGLPMILIPYPFAADNHQKENANYIESQGAAVTIHSTSEDPTRLVQILLGWKDHSEILREMGHVSLALSNVNAAYQTVSYFFTDKD
ncbi:UDP-N-acetylglucosamine--N-acetylmuramyl-(pentapeptide) pyrophosphoryl-undecaprenol N-acetylglucosamine transferase [Leptospira kanakyensis]|uniref:UDP-N-acetylglucosamine--N-acetylmuramyl-(pentapeptide) pyrophosphoryl-undecaprenol N-acetylglucosamine transferase n=1 Tax=Leptospira kanakyensis TaxID=2484968 RepID=A0A6N4QGZ4_9LEPT|nr:UDP-N-acetylglucosamine--N-acetylmuramyl-(pentapeptide) pyrophosphoryl-undecaprenol N-acetylglucosamine transferase [Leptospira kanakyensis]MCW7471119.1 UDP-N-acetylglucosamine--N-acetylmuramyl-(pentapeptide) pyrophosphoryl-undecaprenol N-acetylglucosamine transferase [Leptospira kanakyensis]MCW7481854.1 UDP-N-acetylglucosamine--N-acetylmuramyl-(pentapeptide) pyrophosphoryl-undecaprenol N-acetylglucosamine transferase [Leptospira kanakyensis]TGK53631.1 UDP-N-acetylglucosamine--N-acetylmuramyl